VAILKNHGTVSWGDSVDRAFWWTEILDSYCRILMLSKQIGRVDRLSTQKVNELLDLKEQRDGRTKASNHDTENQSLGQIAEITPEQDFGFLLTKEGGLLYFHRNSLLSGDFDHLEARQEVYYNEDMGDTGPIATKVRVKSKGSGTT
jgi:cold shock CspA family protein